MTDKIRPCIECERPTRPTHSSAVDYPNTLQRRGGKCNNCYRHNAMNQAAPADETRAGLEAFLRARREREAAMKRREKVWA